MVWLIIIFCFEPEHILTLCSEDIVSYFNLKVFGTTNPNDKMTHKLGQYLSLIFYKNAISYFMPNKLLGWNVEIQTGIPTKSFLVNYMMNIK